MTGHKRVNLAAKSLNMGNIFCKQTILKNPNSGLQKIIKLQMSSRGFYPVMKIRRFDLRIFDIRFYARTFNANLVKTFRL